MIVNMNSNFKQWYVYKHTNQINNKSYIGITCQKPIYRWGHEGHNYQFQTKFYNAILKYGWNNFSHEILFENLTKQEALEKETELINTYNTVKEGYNEISGLNEDLYSKEIYCLETGEIFPSVASAARNIPIDASHLSNHLHGKKAQTIFGKHWYFVDDAQNLEHYAADKQNKEKVQIKESRDQLFIKLYNDNYDLRAISEITGSARETISQALKRHDIVLRDNCIAVTALDKDTNEPIKTFSSMYEACQWAGLNGRSESGRIRQAIIESWRTCKGYKWTTNDEELLKLREENNMKYSVNNPPIDLMIEDYNDGYTINDLVKKYGFCDTTIGKWLKSKGIQLAKGGKQGVIALDPNTKQVVREYDSIGDVYRSWNMNPNNQTLGKRCKDHKIYHGNIWYYKEDYVMS